jgi:hypothetical protein
MTIKKSILRRTVWGNFYADNLPDVIMQWHEGQNDPVYAVGSSLMADSTEDITKELVGDAIHNLKLTLRDLAKRRYKGVSRADVADLKNAVEQLQEVYDKMPNDETEED